MGLIRSSGRFVSNTVKHAFGAEAIRGGFGIMRRQWHRVANKVCPKCSKGRLFSFYIEPVDGEAPRFRGCDTCDHYEAWRAEDDDDSMNRLRKIADDRIFADPEVRQSKLRSMQYSSRWWYFFSVVCFSYAIYGAFTTQSLIIFLNTMAVALFVFVRGFAASYRYWQVREHMMFVPGAFRKWLRLGLWLV